MLNRRKLLKYSASSTVLVVAGSHDAHAGGRFLEHAQSQLKLEVSLGSLIGAALGALIYLAFTKAAPAPLIAKFSQQLIRTSTHRDLSMPTKEYLDFRVQNAEGNIRIANAHLGNDVVSDIRAFAFLSRVVLQQTKTLELIRKDTSKSLREVRQQLGALRNQLDAIRLEQERASNATVAYRSAEHQLRSSRIDKDGQVEKKLPHAARESDRLRNYCRSLEDQILRG